MHTKAEILKIIERALTLTPQALVFAVRTEAGVTTLYEGDVTATQRLMADLQEHIDIYGRKVGK